MEKAIELMNRMIPMKKEVKNYCIAYLKKVLNGCNEKYLYFYDENGNPYGERCITVTYDGGRHPEYNTNAFSSVEGIFLKDGEIYLDTEDDGEYSINNINLEELYNLAEYVYEYVEETIE